MKLSSKFFILIIALFFLVLPSHAQDIKDSIVKIYVVYNQHDYYNPWQMYGPGMRSGSGCIIDGNRILTSAHVVADKTFIQVKRADEAKKYIASVKVVAHESDLAILSVTDESFFLGIEPLKIGDLPRLRDKVVTYGFPQGGDELAITEGVVSRIEHQWYTHSQKYLLTAQIDAAINPGSSGGPVIKDGKVVGVAFQAGAGENIGYMVPAPVIKHFLKDMEDGKYDGIPALGISWQDMENPDLRQRYKMDKEQTGVLINKIYPDSPAEGLLKSEDVILSIDGANIANDGTVEFRKSERTSFGYLIQNKFINDTVELQILRDGSPRRVKIQLTKTSHIFHLVPNQQYDIAPTYYILGGLVFEPLTLNFLKTWGGNWYNDAPQNLVNYYFRGEPTKKRRRIIILVQVLADEVNVGYQNLKYNVISEVNGKKIGDMEDLVTAFETNKEKYHVIITEKGYKIVLDKAKAEQSTNRILNNYNISSEKSLIE